MSSRDASLPDRCPGCYAPSGTPLLRCSGRGAALSATPARALPAKTAGVLTSSPSGPIQSTVIHSSGLKHSIRILQPSVEALAQITAKGGRGDGMPGLRAIIPTGNVSLSTLLASLQTIHMSPVSWPWNLRATKSTSSLCYSHAKMDIARYLLLANSRIIARTIGH